MHEQDSLVAAREELSLVLSFFPRADAKLSVVLGVELAMCGVMFAALPRPMIFNWIACAFLISFVVLAGLCFLQLYKGSYPELRGGTASLIYFRSVALLRESEFVHQFERLSMSDLRTDLLQQAWRNSVIVSRKFDSLKSAHKAMLWSTIPWGCLLIYFRGS